MTSLSEANAKFVVDFFNVVRKSHPCENVIFSPVNLLTALHLLLYGSGRDTKAEIEKVLHHLNKAEEHASSGARSHSETATRTDSLGSKLSPDFPKLSNAQAIMSEAVCEAEEGASSFTTSGEDNRQADSNLDLSVAETIPQLDAEEATPYFIPWRKHLLGREEVEYLIHELSSPEGKLSENLASSHENQEEQSRNENMTTAEAPLPTSSSSVQVATDDISALLCVFRHTVEHAENNVQAFKETFDIFKECCDKMCTSMTNLQGVLETLITILRE